MAQRLRLSEARLVVALPRRSLVHLVPLCVVTSSLKSLWLLPLVSGLRNRALDHTPKLVSEPLVILSHFSGFILEAIELILKFLLDASHFLIHVVGLTISLDHRNEVVRGNELVWIVALSTRCHCGSLNLG